MIAVTKWHAHATK